MLERNGRIVACLLVSVLLLTSCKSRDARESNPPNFVFILADDLDVALGGTTPLQKTKTLLQDHGMVFDNAFVTTPLCCPSRSSILTGRYVHNHGTWNNSISGGCSSLGWQNSSEKNTFVTQLRKQNYTTFYAGKYLNEYGMSPVGGAAHVPPGWDWWQGLIGNSVYYNYTISVNGTERRFADDPNKDYLTSVLGQMATEFLKNLDVDSKFFMMISPPCPHAPFTPLPKYAQQFENETAPRTPNFDVPGGKGKHWLVRQQPNPLPETVIDMVDDIFRNRWRTLLSLDDLVESVVNALQAKGILENTYIFFASDNGFHLGQFSLPWDKRQPYEFDIRIPLVVRGPGIRPGSSTKAPVLNIDLAPTFLDLAAVAPDEERAMDGRSLAPFLLGEVQEHAWNDNSNISIEFVLKEDSELFIPRYDFVVEYRGESSPGPIEGCPQYDQGGVKNCYVDCICQDSWNNSYTCLRTLKPGRDTMLCNFQDNELFVEEYNLRDDPFQMNNLACTGTDN